MKPVSFLGVTILLLGPLAAAAQFPGMDKVIKGAKVAAESRSWTPAEEKAIGEATASKLVAVFGLYEEPRAVKYVNLVGAAVAGRAPRQDLAYQFGILDTEMVNAFATPGGYVLVTRGLLANVEDEAELAGVLGHEIIHTSERHIEKELRSRKIAGAFIEEGTAQIPVAEIANLADRISDVLLAGKLSRDKENEADSKGLELAAALGYDPRAFPEFLDYLGKGSAESGNKRFLGTLAASHPKFSDRVKHLQELIAKRGWDKQERPRLAERYQENIVFGTTERETPAAETPAAPASPPAPPAQRAAAPTPASGGQPTTAASKPGSGGLWDLTMRPFSADQITTDGNKRQKMKVYVRPGALRMEAEEKGQKSMVILRLDRKLMWSLMPDEQMYAELPLNWGQSFAHAAQDQ
ncbi:MAG: M48 family metalloprotease [Acidobacteria bacterium]|nr:M48 family metalloprotease [Acidobacteriota bacterium]